MSQEEPGRSSQRPQAPPGWYQAGDGPYETWWDGFQWSTHSRPLSLSSIPISSSSLSPRARAAGWFITAIGAVITLAALLPWASVGVFTVSGTSGDGAITLVFGLLAAGAGLGRALAKAPSGWQVAIPVVCLILAALTSLIALYDIASVSEQATVGIGLVLTLLGGLGLGVASIVGLASRA